METQNIPILGQLLNRFTGDQSPFHCEVYFINKTEQMSVKWGTDSKVQYMEPTYGFPISIGASGEMSLRAEDSRKLLLKLVGTENDLGQQKLIGFFRSFLMTKVKTYIAQIMKSDKISIFEIDEHLTLFSENLHRMLIPDFADYGISLERFFVTNIVKLDGDRQYEKFKELHFRQYADIAEAKLRQQTDIINAQTEAVGQFTNMGVGLGTMAGVGGVIGSTVAGSLNGRGSFVRNAEQREVKEDKAWDNAVEYCSWVLR